MKIQRKIKEADAVWWNGNNLDEVKEIISEDARVYSGCLFIGDVMPNKGEIVIKESDGRIHAVSPMIFEMLYEVVENENK